MQRKRWIWGALLVLGVNVNLSVAKVENLKQERAVLSYFSSCLEGEKTVYTRSKSFDLSDIESYRAIVWRNWKEANRRFDEEKLIEPDTLSEKEMQVGYWNIPASLEPDAVMPYYWGRKGDEKPSQGYPFFLYLHGSGPKEQEWATGLKLGMRFDDAPSVYFIPQIPNEKDYYRWWQRSKQYVWEKLIRQVMLSDELDPDRIYMVGISEGGYGSQRLASYYADYLAAAGPMAGGEPLKNAPAENCANIAFSLRTGEKDLGFYRNILTDYVRETFDSLQQQHPSCYTHWIELIPEMGHGIDYFPTPVWLKKHTRNPYPKFVAWEDFEMDGRHRNGFYNLWVVERAEADADARIYYEMTIDENRIDLSIRKVDYEVTQKDPHWGIEMRFAKHYSPVSQGKWIVYLSPELVDMNRKVTVNVNGKQVYCGKVKPDLKHLVNSCAHFYDPRRLYPAAVEITL